MAKKEKLRVYSKGTLYVFDGFQGYSECVKCGGDDFITEFVEVGDLLEEVSMTREELQEMMKVGNLGDKFTNLEGLLITCNVCGYKWLAPCLDTHV